ncbi:MAG: elongation factor G [Planctomycetes bacterium]|nr:elongation factor G [Planctomycetota bacterium]
MAVHQADDIRNVALVGHSGCGKTSLGEALLFKTGTTSRLGSVDDGSSHLDFDDEAKERKHSVDSAVFHVTHGGKLLNLIDTPGMPDYCGPAIAALAAVDTAAVVISAPAGIGANTRRMFNVARDCGLALMIVVNRIDAENANIEEVLTGVRETFGNNCYPLNLPTNGGRGVIDLLSNESGASDLLDVGEAHTALVEAIVETDDTLMEEYMEAGTIAAEKLTAAIAKAVAGGNLIPVLFTNARGDVGVAELLDALVLVAPSPVVGKQRALLVGEGDEAETVPVPVEASGPLVGQVFKVTSDPRSNIKYSVARLYGGSVGGEGQVVLGDDRKGQRVGHLLKLNGGEHAETPQGTAGDIVAFAKLDMHIGQMVRDKAGAGCVPMPKFPTPMFALAVTPRSRSDGEKLSLAIQRFSEEDPCFKSHRDAQTGELVVEGLGDLHLTVAFSRMKRLFKLEVDTKPPKIPYRETIAGSAKYVEYTHKKQTGGAGQFARVFIDLEPAERGDGYEYIDKIFGGVIDQPFRPSVDKGVRDQMSKGVIAGYPVVDVKVSLVDGKTHPVDSKDIAFQIAGRNVFRKAFMQAKPILLEPIVDIEVTAPTEFVGEITRDLAGKRGQIVGQDMLPGNQVCVRGTVPLAEVATYSSQLKSVTGGQGSYTMELSHYDIVPPNVQQQIVAAYKPHGDEE